MSWILKAVKRDTRKSPADYISAVIYGGGQVAEKISVESAKVIKLLTSNDSYSYGDLEIDGKKVSCILQTFQAHNVTGLPVHIDFLDINKAKTFNVFIPIETVGVSVGVKRGGLLNMNVETLEVRLSKDKLDLVPQSIQIDISALQIGDVVHLNSIQLPDGIMPANAMRDNTILNIISPSGKDLAKEAKDAAKSAKIAAKDVKPASKDAKPASKDAKPAAKK